MSGGKQTSVGAPPKNIGDVLREIAEPTLRDEKIEDIIARSARKTGLSYWRAFDIWYGKARWITQEECDAIEAALDKRRREMARNELHDLKVRIMAMEAQLRQTDADFHEPTIDVLRAAVRSGRKPSHECG